MRILPLSSALEKYLEKRRLGAKFYKQKAFFEHKLFHPSLETELLEPREMRIWSFRIDRKYRAIFIFRDRSTVEIIDINNHYQ